MQPLRAWLEHIGLAHYASLFEDAAIDLEVLPHLTEEHFRQLGLPLGHQIKLLQAAKGLGDQPAPSPPSVQTGVAAPTEGAERRQLTVMFCDLVGSTALSQTMDPEALRETMRNYQETCRDVIAGYQGHVAQYLGDGLMIYFGWPQAHEDDVERALRSALEIVTAVKTVSALAPLQVQIGIATGAVVEGESTRSDVGASRLAVGETPNLAARLQSIAGADEIVIGAGTQRLAGEGFAYQDLGERTLKGILEPVRVFKVLGMRRVEGRFDATHGTHLTPLVGRASEVALLLDRWERAKSGEGQCVLLSAEAGIGKSRITRALRERTAAEPHIAMRYQCSPFHVNSAFHPIIDQFERAAGFVHEDAPREKLAKMDTLLGKAQVNVAEAAPLFAAMLSLPADSYAVPVLSPQQLKDRIIAALIDRVLGLARQLPTMLILEDAHWVDPTTLDVFGALLESIDSARVLVVITYRPEFTPPWLGQSRLTALQLARLSRKETALLAEQVSGKPLPAEVLDQILTKTDGVPLFVEEITKALLESGLLKDAGERFTIAGPLPSLAVPSTLHDSLMARLDRFASCRDVIQLGAVIGREFSHALVAALWPSSPEQLGATLEQLVESELVSRRGAPPDAVYVFKHALVQDAAYESILKSRRQQLHASVAAMLERDSQAAQSDPGFLALHFDRAGLAEKAVEWCMRAGRNAKLRSANREALHHFQRALALLDDNAVDPRHLEQRIDLHIELGLIYMMLEGWASKQAMEHFLEAEKGSRVDPASELRMRTLVGIITTLNWRGSHSEAREYAQELVALAKRSGDRIHRLYAHQLFGQSAMYDGKFRIALAELQQAHALFDDSVDVQLTFQYGHDPGMVALWWVAYMQWETGVFDQAFQSAEKALMLARRIGHPFSLSSALLWTLDLSYFMWLPERIREYAQEAIEVAHRHGFSQWEALGCFHQGWVLAQDGQHEVALEQMTRALDQYRGLGSVAVLTSRMTAQLASVYGQAGRADEALRVLQASPDRAPGRKRVRFAEISRIEGELHLLKPQPEPALAEQFFQEAIAIALEDENRAKQLRAATSLAALWRSQGKTTEAKTLLRPLYDSFTEGFDMPDMKNAIALLDKLETQPV